MTYHLGRGTSQLGQFTEEEIREGVASGQFQASDLAWTDGMADWKPISDVFTGIAAVEAANTESEPMPSSVEESSSHTAPFTSEPVQASSPGAAVIPPVTMQPIQPPYYGQSASGGTGNVGVAMMPTPGTAIASLILGIISLVTCYFGLLFAIPGVICGHIALSKIKNPAFQYDGKGLAFTGLILNYIWLGAAVLILLAFVVMGLIGVAMEAASK